MLKEFETLQDRFNSHPFPYGLKLGGQETSLVVSAGMHGNEQINIRSMLDVLNEYGSTINQSNKGTCFLIGNPKAVIANTRFIEVDLNRSFGVEGNLYEQQRAREIMEGLGSFSYALDLHQTIGPTEQPFGIFPELPQLMQFFSQVGVENVVCTDPKKGSNVTCFDEYYSLNRGVCSIVVEVGSIQDDPHPMYDISKNAILSALQYVGVLPGFPKHVEITPWKQEQLVMNGDEVKLVPGLVNFGQIKRGQIVAHDGEKEIGAAHDGVALFPKYLPSKDKYILRVAKKMGE